MGDTKALQAGTSHFLGQNFAKAFNIQFSDESNQLQYAWTTSWGVSTRFIGAIIMTHGDDQGLVMPPKLAPIQVVIVPIGRTDADRAKVLPVVESLRQALTGFRVKVDDRAEQTPGFKFNDWEMRGVPLRIEIGPRDVDNGVITLARRDKPGKEAKITVSVEQAAGTVAELLTDIHASLYDKAVAFRDSHIHDPKDFEEFKQVVEGGWAFSWWCGDKACEAGIKEETRATTRCIPLEQPGGTGKCIHCGKPATEKAMFAKAY
jgi:prolyl-tRNA synthetase